MPMDRIDVVEQLLICNRLCERCLTPIPKSLVICNPCWDSFYTWFVRERLPLSAEGAWKTYCEHHPFDHP
jgi:hypothetical protein